jgi:hypothetical protein
MATELHSINLTPDQYTESISTAFERYIEFEQRQTPSRRQYCYAGSFEPCERKLVLLMTDGEKVVPFPTDTLAKFHRGKERERGMIIDLTRAGQYATPRYSVIGQQERFELRDHKGRVAIVGKVDLRLDYGRNAPCPPVEIKDWDPNMTAKMRTFDDVLDGQWTRKGAYQLLCYLFGAGESWGLLALPRPGLPRLIPVELFRYLDRVEEFLMKAERALDHREAGTLPDHIQDAAECKRCQFYGSVCNPPLMSGQGAVILTDPELEAMLDRREELKEAALEYDGLDEDVKKKLRGVEQGVAGKYLIEGKWGKSSRVELPPDLKKEYTKTDPKGRFTISITKL